MCDCRYTDCKYLHQCSDADETPNCLLDIQVLFKMFLGSANLGEVAHFLSTMGFFNLIFISCVPLILYFTRVEHLGSLSSLPWGYLCGLAGLWLGESTYTS